MLDGITSGCSAKPVGQLTLDVSLGSVLQEEYHRRRVGGGTKDHCLMLVRRERDVEVDEYMVY